MVFGAFKWLPVLSIFLLSPVSYGATAATCVITAFPTCDQLGKGPLDASKDPSLGVGTRSDGGQVFNPFAIIALSKNDKPRIAKLSADLKALGQPFTPGELKKFNEEKEKARAIAISVIANGLSEPNWTPEQRVLVQRLRTVQITAGYTDQPECSQMVIAGFPNAAYAAETHTLNVCPSLMRMTEAQFLLSLGHELGHVVQSCFATSALYSYKPEDFKDGPLSECSSSLLYDENSEEGGPHKTDIDPYLNILRGTSDQEKGFSIGPVASDTVNKLKSCKSLVPMKNSFISQPKIFSKTDACIAKYNEASYRDSKAQGDFKRSEVGGETEESVRDRNQPRCFNLSGEDFADAFATKVVAAAAKGSRGFGKPEGRAWNAADIKSAMLFQKSYVCAEQVIHVSADDHPVAEHRLRTYLDDTSLTDKLSCQLPKTADLCPIEISNGAGVAPSPKSPVRKSRGVK